MQAKVLLALLLCAIATPVLAGDLGMAPAPALVLAQLTPEELSWIRERWRQASPEERVTLRRQFQEMLQQLTPEQRQHQSESIFPWTPPPSPADIAGAASNFGAGFEQRHPDPSSPKDNAPSPDPRDLPGSGWFGR